MCIRDRIISEYQKINRHISIVCYANDAVLVAHSEDNMHRLLHEFIITALTAITQHKL